MSDLRDDLVGTVLGGYRLLEVLGRGGAGSVYRAVDRAGAPWAVKVLHRRSEPGARGRLEREKEVADRVTHPNLVRVAELGEDRGAAFLVMEMVDGVSLRQALTRAERLPISDVVHIAIQALRGLHAVHTRGVVHRDVKPSNLLLAPGPEDSRGRWDLVVKLSDFGVALIEGQEAEQGGEGQILGTVGYLAPEQLRNPDAVDGRADLYALGCTLFEALCGRRPFQGDLVAQLYQTAQAPRPDPREVRHLPSALAGVIGRLLAVDPQDRPADAPAVIAALEAVMEDRTAATTYDGDLYAPSVSRGPPASVEERTPPTAAALPRPTAPAARAASAEERTPPTGEGPAHRPLTATVEPATAPPASPAAEPVRRFGPYQVLQLVGRDYATDRYLARDAILEVEVMLEVLSERAGFDGVIVERFLRRARAGARVKHPNVQMVYAFHLPSHGDRTAPYCVLELLRGRTLEVRLQEGPLPFPQILDIVEGALLGLHAVHSCGLIHRDLKPSNLFLEQAPPAARRGSQGSGDRPLVKLCGFQLVGGEVVEERLTAQGAILGTPAYMSPEQAFGGEERIGPRSDLYSLGCLLFEMACGRRPYTRSGLEVLRQHVEEEVPDPARFRPDLPPRLRNLIRRLMSKRPDDRFASAEAALQALDEARSALWPWTKRVSRAIGGFFRRLLGGPPAEAAPAPRVETRSEREAATEDSAPPKRLPRLPRPEDQAFSAQTVLTYYPAPIAVAFRRFCRQAEPRARLDRLFYAVEAALRYLTTLAVCDLFACRAGANGASLELPAHPAFDFLRRPRPMQLGLWLEALREAARELAGQPGLAVRELPEVCAPGGRVEGRIVPGLIALRNRTAHAAGGIAATPDECAALCREARPALEELLEQIRFICDYPLGFVQKGLDLGRQAGQRPGYYLHSCMGAAVQNTGEAYHIQTEAPLKEAVPFVVGAGGRLLYLWPLLLHRVSPVSERHTLYAFEDLPDRNWPFLSQTRSAAIDVRDEWRQPLHPQPAASHAWLLGPLREFRKAAAAPSELELQQKLLPWRGGTLTGLKLDGTLLQAPVGRGGFGAVYVAVTPRGERVAVKVLEAASVSPRQMERFRQEFERLRRLDPHPGIIRCFEMSAALIDGRVYPWYSMEFALGGDLGDRAEERRGGPLGPAPWRDAGLRAQVIAEFRQVAAAAAHLHKRRVIHRDIKPSNVLVMEDGTLRLSDFGLAKSLEPSEKSLRYGPMTSSGAVLGTRHYMAPEQEKGQEVGEPGDVYALGVLLAELAVGERPRPNTGVSDGSTLQAWKKMKQLPDGLRGFICRLTAAVPERRPADASEVEREFEELLNHLEG
jgi:serine/threonine-protein kinase